ncbi:hypothetical protein GW17_00015725 [Ensete ventricosum]|nr:hypothetical protein GW17_00015725 [Ensete ventricosum]
MDLDNYSWTQTLQEVTVNIPVPQGTKSRFVTCEIKKTHLKVGLRGQPLIIDADLYQPVKAEDCFWSIGWKIHFCTFDQAKSDGMVEMCGKG